MSLPLSRARNKRSSGLKTTASKKAAVVAKTIEAFLKQGRMNGNAQRVSRLRVSSMLKRTGL